MFAPPARDPDAIRNEALNVIEIDTGDRIVAAATFDLEDFDAAIAELDARYLAGEAAAYAHTWSVVAGSYAGFNRRELLATTPDWVNIDHRRGAAFAPGDMIAYLQAAWDDSPDTKIYIAAVHRLGKIGAVVSHVARGISQEGFDAEWRDVNVLAVEGDMLSRSELFDETDLDAAIARFDQLSRPAPRLENTASQVDKRFQACFAARDWDAMAEMLSEGFSVEDRRRVVNMGNLHGRDAELTVHAYAAVGSENVTSTVIATRAQRLALSHYRFSGRDQLPDAFRIEMLVVVEIDADDRMAAVVVFDADDIDAAIAELDARYVAGEAAANAHTWSAIVGCYAEVNRREIPATTTDFVNIDHRRVTPFAPGEVKAYTRASWNQMPDISYRIETVHRLSDRGAVITHAIGGASQDGFEAEWREIHRMTVDGEMVSRMEVFDEGDLDAALAKFDQLSRSAPRLENVASQMGDRFLAHFATGDWDAMAEILADNLSNEDRRRVVSTGVFDGRDAQMANTRAIAELWSTNVTRTVVATRGRSLALARITFSRRDEGPDAFLTEVLIVNEIDTDEKITSIVVFDLDDIDAAIAELDARYVAGEAAANAHTWSAIVGAYGAINRRELPATTPDFEDEDHRRGAAFATGDMIEYLRAGWDLDQDISFYVEAVHRLSDLGAVVTHKGCGTSREGFDAEWREVMLFAADGDSFSRCEVFDEADLDAAITRFEELSRSAPRLENAASRANARFIACVNARDWDAIASILAEDHYSDDRRRVTGAGIRRGRDADIENVRVVADLGANTTVEVEVIATRGDRLVLTRTRISFDQQQQQQGFVAEVLGVIETNLDGRIAAVIFLDPEDFAAAFEELDARYLTGEASAHADTWSVITSSYAAFNRHELPAADWDTVDHRRATPFASSTMTASLRAIWDLTPDLKIHIEAVHRLNSFGAVITHTASGSSPEGFDAEWRAIDTVTLEGHRINRCEIYDEADLDVALARFDELDRPAPRLENAASQVAQRFLAYFAASDWDAMAEILADNFFNDDRRPLVSFGVLHGRDAQMANMRAIAELLSTDVTSTVIATRAARLVLVRLGFSDRGQGPNAFQIEALGVVEIDTEDRIAAFVAFDINDFEGAFAELDARYLAGEAAPFANTWSAVAGFYAALNRHEILATPDWVNVDHRRATTVASGDMAASIRATWDVAPNITRSVEAVHRLNNLGAVVTHTADGTSREGFDAEWRLIALLTFTGDLISRCELFDEADLDAALARFDELHPQAPRPENAATRTVEQFFAHFAVRDWDAMAELLADHVSADDRRSVVNAGIRRGRDAEMANWRATDDLWTISVRSTVATRGERLALVRFVFTSKDGGPQAFSAAALAVIEISDSNRIRKSSRSNRRHRRSFRRTRRAIPRRKRPPRRVVGSRESQVASIGKNFPRRLRIRITSIIDRWYRSRG